MCWTPLHDEIFIREVLLFQPWEQRKGTPERGTIWKNIAESLNAIKEPIFKVELRSVREHFNLLQKKYLKKKLLRKNHQELLQKKILKWNKA